MKKRLGALTLALVMAIALAIPAGAADTECLEVSEEQYQGYLEIAKEVSEERGIEITVGDRANMSRVYTDKEFENEVEEFCDVIDALTGSISVTAFGDNPSDDGHGEKTMTVNTSKTIDNGYFLFTITGKANVTGVNPYYFGNVSIENIVAVKSPSSRYACVMSGSSTSATVSSSVKTAQRNMVIYKDNSLMATVRVQAKFSLNQSTGVVTMTGSSWVVA